MLCNFIDEFRAAMVQHGLETTDEIVADGVLHRIHIDGDKNGAENGYYALHIHDNFAYGIFGSWKLHGGDGYLTWCSKQNTKMTSEEKQMMSEQIKKSKEQSENAKKERRAKAKVEATQIWKSSPPAQDDHPYLKSKKVKAHNIRVSIDNKLIIPLYGADKEIHTLQYIPIVGRKDFLSGGQVQQHYFPIGGRPTDKLFIAEGYATGVSIHEITFSAVACAFNCGNLFSVAKLMREKFPDIKIVIAADNDQWPNKDGVIDNVGLKKAQEAAKEINADVIYPDFTGLNVASLPTDFNDLMLLAGVEETRRQLNQSPKEDWPEPEEIKNELLPVEQFIPELIPEPLRHFVVDVSERMQCPIDFVAVASFIAIATVVGSSIGIRPKKEDDWLVIPNLWGCIVGRPGLMKSPAVNEVIHFLDKLQDEAKDEQGKRLDEYYAEMEVHKAKREAIKNQMGAYEKDLIKNGKSDSISSDVLKTRLKELKEPEKPIWRRFKTNDSTIEKLNELLSENPRGLLVYRDELTGWLKSFDKQGREMDRAFFLEAWNGYGSQTSDRIARGTTHAENLCLSVFGTTQPDKLLRYLITTIHGDNDGLIQRLQLLVYPDESINWQRIDRVPNLEGRKKAEDIIRALAKMDFILKGISEPEEDIPYLRFDDDAQNLFYEWWEELEHKLREDEHPLIIEHLSKYRSLMPSLALLFHLIDQVDIQTVQPISLASAERAAACCEYFESHARRIYALVTDLDVKAAALLSQKIAKGKLEDGFTVRDVYRQNWSILNNRSIAQAACNELVEANWLREKLIDLPIGSKRKVTYSINPKVKRGGI